MSVFALIGTRPEAIKMAPVIKALQQVGIRPFVIGTGQHSDWKMLGTFLAKFDIGLDHALELPARDLLSSFVTITQGIGELIQKHRPGLVIAQGDTTTVVSAAFAARKTGCAFGHVEAGLRAFSRELPEEEHRICADAIADLLFAPTRIAQDNLVREHVNGEIYLTGNTVLDALLANPPPQADKRDGILVTVHRQETVDDKVKFGEVISALEILAQQQRVCWPMHPRAQSKLQEFGYAVPAGVQIEAPLSHDEFLARLNAAELVVSDSGGVQEEAAILGTPCVAVRGCTERPETLAAGVGLLAGIEKQGILDACATVMQQWASYARPAPHLYGDGKAGEIIADVCQKFLAGEAPASEHRVKRPRLVHAA